MENHHRKAFAKYLALYFSSLSPTIGKFVDVMGREVKIKTQRRGKGALGVVFRLMSRDAVEKHAQGGYLGDCVGESEARG